LDVRGIEHRQFLRHHLHQLPFIELAVDLESDFQHFWDMTNIRIDILEFSISIERHSKLHVSLCSRQMPLVFWLKRHLGDSYVALW